MHIRKVLAAQLDDRIDRLQASFAALNSAVREKVAEIVGQSVKDLVTQAIRAILDPPSEVSAYAPEDDDELWNHDPEYRRSHTIDQDVWQHHRTKSPVPKRTPLPRATTVVVFGLQAACCWLTRARNVNLPSFLFVGLCACGVAYALGPIAVAFLPAMLVLTLVGQSTGIIGSILN